MVNIIIALETFVLDPSHMCIVRCGIFQGLNNMWTSILCPTKLDAIFHDLKCLERQCDFCGTNMFMTCFIEEDIRSEKLMS
jgi:hypothetical protein